MKKLKSIKAVIAFLTLIPLAALVAVSNRQPIVAVSDRHIITKWNHLTYQIAYQHDQFYSLLGIRTLSMTHLAMHNALNAIEPRYETYAFDAKNGKADPVAAVCEAARTVLLDAYPDRKDTIRQEYDHWMNQLPDNEAKREGIALGRQAGKMIIALREGDGHEKQGDYTPMSKPGDYQYTPGWDGWVLKPDFDYARPFCLDSVTQFRSPEPPALNSEAYLQSFREVKAYGRKDSPVRTADQTHYAHWWAEFAEHSWNRIGRMATNDRNLSLWESARMFALINMDIYDIYLASLESKYYYDTWRPYTAIRAAATDQNRHTEPDTSWQPEMLTPPWPEYPSAHASVGSGGAEILTHVFGTADISFTMESVSALPEAKTRTYHNLDEAAADCADSRIMNGYHFRFATEEGKRQGRQIAKFIWKNFLKKLE